MVHALTITAVPDLLDLVDEIVRQQFVTVLVPTDMDPLDRENEACRVDDQAAVDTGLEQYEA